MKIKDIVIETTAGGIAVVAQPMNIGTIKRPNPSVYKSPKKKKTPKKESSVNITK